MAIVEVFLSRFHLLAFALILLPSPFSFADVSNSDALLEGVEHALQHAGDPALATIKATVDKGIIHLSGRVNDLAAKNLAVEEAEKIRGCVGVVDEIIVVPVKISDDVIATNVRRRIIRNVQSDDLKVECENGVVKLTGNVADFSQRMLATTYASEIAGVQSVTNKLFISTESKRSDSEIEADIVKSWDRNVFLQNLPIHADVQDGFVTLTGKVGSPYERRLASHEVEYVSHVNGIENKIKIDPELNGDDIKQRAKPTDEEISTRIEEELSQDSRVANLPLDVSVSNGHATLAGTVNEKWQREAAEGDANDTVGVIRVTDKIVVNPTFRTDAFLRDDLTVELGADAILRDQDIRVNVIKGEATLSGVVNNLREYNRAVSVANRISGIREVVNMLDIEPRDVAADDEAKEAIETSLNFNVLTFEIAPLIDVSVDNGVVSLKGEVAYLWQKKIAEQIASRTLGVRKVENHLSIAPTP